MTGILPIGIGGAVLFALLMSGRKSKGSSGSDQSDGSGRPPWPKPIWVPTGPNGDDRIRAEICRQTVPGGTVLTPVLAKNVWAVIWQGVPWPPQPTDHPTVLEAAEVLDRLIGEYLADPVGFCSRFEDDQTQPDPSPSPTPIDIAEFEDPYPTPGLMYQVVYGDILGGTNSDRSIAYRALLSAGYVAATQLLGLDQEAASQFARDLARNQAARAIYIRLIQCDLFNSLYYDTEGFDSAITSGVRGADGRTRALRFLPVHADNRARLKDGLPPLRRIDRVTGSATAGKLEYLHLPLLDLEAIANANAPLDDRIVVGVWSDGSTGMLPPPPIQAVMNLAVVPSGVYGCGSNTITV